MIKTLIELKEFENKCLFSSAAPQPAAPGQVAPAGPAGSPGQVAPQQRDTNDEIMKLVERYKANRSKIDNIDKIIQEAEAHRNNEAFNTDGWHRADAHVFDLYDTRKVLYKNGSEIEVKAAELGYDFSSFLLLTKN